MGCKFSKVSPGEISVEKDVTPEEPKQLDVSVTKLQPGRIEEYILNRPITANSTPLWTFPTGEHDEFSTSDDAVEDLLQESIGSRISAFSFTTSHVIQDGGAYRFDEEYGLIITEHSTPEKVQRVERAFQEPEDLELLVEGKPFGIQRAAATDETVLDTDEVLQKLRDEGLVMRPESVASGGVKFELVASDSLGNQMSNPKVRRLPPICLQRREKQRKKKRNLTYERIVEKLKRAEERRKQQEEEKLSKVTSKEKIDEVSNIVVQQAEEKRQKQNEKMEAITKSREKRLEALQNKLRAHDERAQKVRQRKKSLSKVPTIPEDQELMDRFHWGFGEEEKTC